MTLTDTAWETYRKSITVDWLYMSPGERELCEQTFRAAVTGLADYRAYTAYIEFNLELIERGGWTPICFAEFMTSEEREVFDFPDRIIL